MTVPPAPRQMMWVVLSVSAGVLAFEIALLRILTIATWHHFAFLVISGALLGFGASGTCLFLLRDVVLPRAQGLLWYLALATALSMPVCTSIAQRIPVESHVLPALLNRQVLFWLLFWVVLCVPFFVGASAIGLALMIAKDRVGTCYAVNLLGSALGSVIVSGLMYCVAPAYLPVVCGSLVLLGCLAVPTELSSVRGMVVGLSVAVVALWLTFIPPRIHLDSYKFGAYVQRLVNQHQAQRTARRYSPQSLLEAFSGGAFHDLPFLTGDTTPPPITVLLADGHLAGSVLAVSKPAQANVADERIPAFAYDLAVEHPRVLQLGMRGTADIWLAIRRSAACTDVVQPDTNVFRVLTEDLHDYGAAVFARHAVTMLEQEPRHYIEHTQQKYDLIQLVAAESSSAGSGGIGGLNQDYLITVEGMAACLDRLDNEGVLTVTRGVQKPPRDNLKLLATLIEALRRTGVQRPQDHIVVVRDFLAVCTVVKATPFSPGQIKQVRGACAKRTLTPIWFSGVQPSELNRPDEFEPAPRGPGDWYHYAALELFSSNKHAFEDSWPYYIRPATDNRPFFSDYFKLSALPGLRAAYGELWLTRVELAFVFVVAAFLVVGISGTALIVLPLAVAQKCRSEKGKCATFCYFGAIGIGYLILEIAFLSKMTAWIGDPVRAAAVTITAFLLFSGLGSLSVSWLRIGTSSRVAVVCTMLIVTGTLQFLYVDHAAALCAQRWSVVRLLCAFVYLAPLAFLMGLMMPSGLAQLHRGAAVQVPWAWGINGVASVLAAPLATAIGMSAGFSYAATLALLVYVVPAFAFSKLPTSPQD